MCQQKIATKMSTEIKKMKQGMSYSCKEKTIILNVFKYFKSEFPDTCVTELVRKTAKATGCSEKSVFHFRKEEASAEGFKVPSKTKIRKNININSRSIKYDESVRQSIRNIIHDLECKNIVPSLNKILRNIHSDSQLPKFSLMTLRRLLCDMGFSYNKVGNKAVLIENSDSSNHMEKNKKERKKSVNLAQNKINDGQIIDNLVPSQHVSQNCVDLLPKPTPQHPLPHTSGNINMHLGHIGQPLDQQMAHHPLMVMPPPYPVYNHPMMGQTMHMQPPMSDNQVMLTHSSHSSHMVPPPLNIHPNIEGDNGDLKQNVQGYQSAGPSYSSTVNFHKFCG